MFCVISLSWPCVIIVISQSNPTAAQLGGSGSMVRKLDYEVFPDDGVFVARCLDVEVASDGATEQTAVANLQEALALYFESKEPTAFGQS